MRFRLLHGGSLAGIVFGVVALALITTGYIRGTGTNDWQEAKGEVISCELERVLKIPFISSHGQTAGGRGLSERSVRILYKYAVGGGEYISDDYEVGFLGFTTNMRGSENYLKNVLNVCGKFSPGAEILIYYDSDDPASALVEKGYRGFLPTYLIFILAVIGAGVYGMIKR